MDQRVTVAADAGGVRVITCAGEFDQDTLDSFRQAAAQAVADAGVARIVVDVSAVAFADSSMLNALVQLRRSGRLVLAGPLPAQMDRLFELVSAHQIFTIVGSVEAARAL
ncbi:STAS domain-containing protein [Streptomyces sp. NPDC048507]|uniref:STAS domain-containing protein n=1 Tax=Streptomyces sp. NPDC048507 TaxID=3365560 RepID=UPI00371A29AA